MPLFIDKKDRHRRSINFHKSLFHKVVKDKASIPIQVIWLKSSYYSYKGQLQEKHLPETKCANEQPGPLLKSHIVNLRAPNYTMLENTLRMCHCNLCSTVASTANWSQNSFWSEASGKRSKHWLLNIISWRWHSGWNLFAILVLRIFYFIKNK